MEMSTVLLQLESINPSSIMYIFGLLFGALSVLYFAKDILLSLSITVKSYALFVLSTLVFSASFLFTESALYVVLIALSGISYSVAVLYTWKTNPLDRTPRFLLLMMSSILFVGIATGVQNGVFSNNTNVVIAFVGCLFGIFLILSVIDVRESSPVNCQVSVKDEVNVEDRAVIGTVNIENEGQFRRRYERPNLKVFYKKNEEKYEVPSSIERGEDNQTVGRKSKFSLDITGNFARYTDPRSDSNIDIPENVELVEFEDNEVILG